MGHSNLAVYFVSLVFFINYLVTVQNWQKWKSTFLTCPCHKIYREEAVDLKSSNYTLKVMIFVNMWNLGQFLENLIFCQQLLNCKFESKIPRHICDTYNCDYLQHTTFRFYLIDFHLSTDSLPWNHLASLKDLYVKKMLLTLIYPAHFEDVPCQSGVNHIFEG